MLITLSRRTAICQSVAGVYLTGLAPLGAVSHRFNFNFFLIPAGKRTLGRPRSRWEDDIRKDLKEIGISTRNWVDSAQDRDYWRALMNAALSL